jgi:YesN/AraC family two-component response regulator
MEFLQMICGLLGGDSHVEECVRLDAAARLVWIDLRQVIRGSTSAGLAGGFVIKMASRISQIQQSIVLQDPDFLVFEYDFPDIHGLQALQQTKAENPRLPILMLTQQHSEELAVWAFRSGVRDYVVKPLERHDLYHICTKLVSVTKTNKNDTNRQNCIPHPTLPWDSLIKYQSTSDDSLARGLEYLNAHFHKNVSLETVASVCGLSRFEFSRLFRKKFGITFREYVIRCKIDKAAELLDNPHTLVIDVAHLVGITDPSHFARSFRRYTGMTPSEYRESSYRRELNKWQN